MRIEVSSGHHAGSTARATVAIVAVVLLAWLCVLLRDTHLMKRGVTLSHRLRQNDVVACARSQPSQGHDCDAFQRATADLRGAGFLNPDPTPDLRRRLLLGSGDWRRLAAAAEGTIRQEPDNVDAWIALRFVATGHDRARVSRAQAALRRLDPLDFKKG